MTLMGDRRADKRLMKVSDPEADRRRERELHDKAKRSMRGRQGGRDDGENHGGSQEQSGREGDRDPSPSWWTQQQERKRKKKPGQHHKEFECKPMDYPNGGGGHGDPLAKKPRATVVPFRWHSVFVQWDG
ncbi:hypothetical protein D1007_56107 [Hordeum vulgare]|nr:hypothetical protein D1007_56107 [Hordeum vulgare]KAI4995929.1 hypothetical protein ZWY2020_040431 [Hordeum vulgare]